MDTESTSPTDEQVVQAICEHAISLMAAGKTRKQVEADLKAQGIDEESASFVTNKIFRVQANAYMASGAKAMLSGVLICVIGIAVTAATYGIASSGSGGGHYVIAYGAVLVGAFQLLRGLFQLIRGLLFNLR
jgi:hypothetical protein